MKASTISFLLFFTFISTLLHASITKNGFDLSNSLIEVENILSGGPPKDGIPAIFNPHFIPGNRAEYLNDSDMVIGITSENKSRAYPLRILIWHEIVNDTFGDLEIAVTYCPLCGTAMVFDRKIDEKLYTFGVSGLLYQSDVLLYDRESESLWSQLGLKAISGSAAGKKIRWIASNQMTWKEWQRQHPDSDVLSTQTGFNRNYTSSPYSSYFSSPSTMFQVPHYRNELPQKSWVVGIIIDGIPKAYSLETLKNVGTIKDEVERKLLTVSYDKDGQHAKITDNQGTVVPSVMSYWFAWQAFYPDTKLWPKNQ